MLSYKHVDNFNIVANAHIVTDVGKGTAIDTFSTVDLY